MEYAVLFLLLQNRSVISEWNYADPRSEESEKIFFFVVSWFPAFLFNLVHLFLLQVCFLALVAKAFMNY